MGYYSSIFGTIRGFSEESCDLIEDDLAANFEAFSHVGNELEIGSYAKHYDLDEIFNKIAFCIDGDEISDLEIKGEEYDDISLVFFRSREWIQEWAKIKYPENPFEEEK